MKGLPAKVPHPSDICEESLLFFREHFRLAFSMHIAGGDIRSRLDITPTKEYQFMEAMKVDEDHPPSEEDYIRNRSQWQSMLGLELLSILWPLEDLPEVIVRENFSVN